MYSYFPPIHPYITYRLPVEPPHEIYVEECGNPQGLPILYLHGGPGSGCSETSRQLFDPERFRIILFDQRGAGRSTPYGELQHNTTQSLLRDIEAIRQMLKIERWAIVGNSWGATLGLVYAQTFPQHVLAMILVSTFLNRNQDVEWMYGPLGVNQIFPDHWHEFLSVLPANQHHNPIVSYYSLLTGADEVARMRAAEAWASWGAHFLTLTPDPALFQRAVAPHEAIAIARLQCHYWVNNCFLKPNQLENQVAQLPAVPSILIHGRYDMICTLSGVWQLHKQWTSSILEIVPNAGHYYKETGMLDAIIRATNQLSLTPL